jgi:hypothetical protein
VHIKSKRGAFMEVFAHSNTGKDLTNFTLFPNLPRELRKKIFEVAMPSPRTITITTAQGGPSYCMQSNARGILPTSLMHVCCASREIALRKYEKAFKESLQHQPIYFDWDNDSVYFDDAIQFH